MTPTALAELHAAAMDAVPGPWAVSEFESLLAMPGVFVVSEGGAGSADPRAPRDISGPIMDAFALGRIAADEVELLTLAVHPRARRAGVGRACLAAFERKAMARGAARAFLEVAETNKAARALYSRAGYGEDGRRKRYYANDVDALLMSKSLTVT